MTIGKLRMLLKEKENNICMENDKEKIKNLKFLLNQDDIFFKLGAETAVGILEFLGIPKDKIYDSYLSLISAENFHNVNLSQKK